MKIEKHISTKVTLTNKEVTEIIKKHIKDTLNIDVTGVDYFIDVNDTLDLEKVVCYLSTNENVK